MTAHYSEDGILQCSACYDEREEMGEGYIVKDGYFWPCLDCGGSGEPVPAPIPDGESFNSWMAKHNMHPGTGETSL